MPKETEFLTCKQQHCKHNWYIWAEDGAEWGRCRKCKLVQIIRYTDTLLKGLYPRNHPQPSVRHYRIAKGIGDPDPSIEGVIKKRENEGL